MILDCEGFERRLEAFVERRLPPREALAAREHVERCDTCRELLALADAAAPRAFDLAPAVLARTSGSSCGKARGMIGDLIDGDLVALDAALVAGHLAGCAECRRLASVVADLRRDLPLLAELDPGHGFTAAVLARTRMPADRADLLARWSTAWRRILLRPRFALEAAYVLTAIVLVVFGVPGDLLAGFSRQVRDVAAVELPARIEGTVRDTGGSLRSEARRAWRETGAPIALDARRSLAEAAAYSSERLERLKDLVGTLWARVASEPRDDVEEPAGNGDRQDGTEQNDDRD